MSCHMLLPCHLSSVRPLISCQALPAHVSSCTTFFHLRLFVRAVHALVSLFALHQLHVITCLTLFVGVHAAAHAAFVLVAGGLGERLGFSGIKLALPADSARGACFLQVRSMTFIQSCLYADNPHSARTIFRSACRLCLACMFEEAEGLYIRAAVCMVMLSFCHPKLLLELACQHLSVLGKVKLPSIAKYRPFLQCAI